MDGSSGLQFERDATKRLGKRKASGRDAAIEIWLATQTRRLVGWLGGPKGARLHRARVAFRYREMRIALICIRCQQGRVIGRGTGRARRMPHLLTLAVPVRTIGSAPFVDQYE